MPEFLSNLWKIKQLLKGLEKQNHHPILKATHNFPPREVFTGGELVAFKLQPQ